MSFIINLPVLRFNSIKVRLKVVHVNTGLFEFCGFNSIKVRLKAFYRIVVSVEKIRFNSIKVRLKVEDMLNTARLMKRFNSIKVRLKGLVMRFSMISINWFQFHKGAIKRLAFRLPAWSRLIVSIP